MFELNLKVSVDTKTGKTIVTNTMSTHDFGATEEPLVKEFPNPLKAYMFVGDYFYDMIDSLVASLTDKAELN